MHIKVMPDYCSSGIWNMNPADGYELDPMELGFPEDLVIRIKNWIKIYSEAVSEDKEAWEGGSKIDVIKFSFVNGEALYIAQEIKKLYPDWTVELWLETCNDEKLDGMVKMTMTEVFKYKI